MIKRKTIKLKLMVLLLGLFLMTGCSTVDDVADDSSEGSEISSESEKLASGDIENSEVSDEDSALDAESEIAGESESKESSKADEIEEMIAEDSKAEESTVAQAAEEPIVESNSAEMEPDVAEEVPAPVISEPPQVVAEETLEAADPSKEVRITGLAYKANENGGTIVIQADGPIEYTTQENAGNNQFVIEMQNVILPKKFQRPYNTKEFSGPVGLMSATQTGDGVAKVVIQLKKQTEISVVQEGNSLILVPGAMVAESTPVPEVQGEVTVAEEPSIDESGAEPLATKTLDEFLLGETKYYGRKISIEVSDGELREVISFISEESGVNLILSDEVKGKISVKLRQIPWDQALVLIMQTKQLGYIRQGNVLRIAPLLAIRNEADAARQLLESQKLLEPLKVKIFPVSYSKAKDLEPQAVGFLSSRGSARADERTNSLVVKDIAENIVKIEKLVANLDTQTPQVYIEGRIVETRSSLIQKIGINWRSATGSSGTLLYGLASNSLTRSGSIGLEASLDLLETEEQVKVLSAPRIVTLNNQQATIEQISQFPIYNETVDENGNVTKTVEFKPIKLNLNVTPQIAAQGGVILKTELLREFAGAIDQNGGTTGARAINSRSAKTTILVENGQTAVLGGIYQSDNTKSNAGFPFLRKIPILGWLFGEDNNTHEKNELLIFLTPRILNKDKAFQVSEGIDESSNL